ncbi:MAG: S1C family serine protease [Roseburia sp.]
MAENDQGEYSFIKEKIKEKPINKKRVLLKICFTVFLAVLFGLVACLVFTLSHPFMERWLQEEDEQQRVSLSEGDTETETQEVTRIPGVENSDSVEAETGSDVDFSQMTVDDYQRIQSKLYAIGTQANRSIVTVTGVKSDTDWFNTPYESHGQSSGVIVANNGPEILIMTEKKVIEDVKAIRVTFIDGVTVDASLKKYDGSTGIAILSVPVGTLNDDTLNHIQIATLGNALAESPGSVVIAVGSPLGSTYSVLAGNITSTGNTISAYDSNYSIFTTDIVGSSDGSGVLLNVKGEIVGVIMQDYSYDEANTLTAISISEVKDIIEMLLNNQSIPYLGLKVSTVTDEIKSEYDIPKGVYIKQVAVDSPALDAGLQSGDVIVEIDGESVKTVQDYRSAVLGKSVGDTIRIKVMRMGAEGYSEVSCRAVAGVLQ